MTIKESVGYVLLQISNLNSKRFVVTLVTEYLIYLITIARLVTGDFGVGAIIGVAAWWVHKESTDPSTGPSLKDSDKAKALINGDIIPGDDPHVANGA